MIAELLAELRNRPPESWAEALRAKFPDDPALVAQALVWLHASRAQAWDHDAAPMLGDDRYELGVMLDAGATAAVWQAYDRKLRRNVAIKLFRPDQSPALGEILAEARAAADVTSDHVVRVLDVHDGDPAYLVMELVGEYDHRGAKLAPGGSAQVIRPHDRDEAVRWVRDVARGVHDAHLRNVFHRDLKPHNVLITPFSRRARIADFGLAITGQASVARGAVRLAGTPEYMAPEQARGLPHALDPHDASERALLVGIDVFGLGALAFELCAGEPPWQARDGEEPWELAATATEAPALADGSRRLRRIVAKAMAIDPAARYATAGELGDELDAYLARRPTTLDRGWPTRLALWCRRNPQLTITALLALVLAALTATSYATIRAVRGQRNELAAESARLAAHAKEVRGQLADTELSLAHQTAALDTLEATLADAKKDYDLIVAAKESALRDADAATKQLAGQLDAARADRDTAQLGRSMYEGFWTRARNEADQAAHDRDEAVHERDAARAERDQSTKERDAARAELAQAEADRDAAQTERDRAEGLRRRAEAELAHLLADFSLRDGGVADAVTPAD